MNTGIHYRQDFLAAHKTRREEILLPSISCGLSSEEVERSRRLSGSNHLTPGKKIPFLRSFLHNLNDPIIKILIAALAVNTVFSFSESNWPESLGIALTVLISTLVTTLSEHSSGTAFEQLYSTLHDTPCHVIRDGTDTACPVSELVRYDIVHVFPGDTIPADGVLLSGSLTCDEAPLTGESRPVSKIAASPDNIRLESGNPSSLFRGAHVVAGNGLFLVLAVGDATMYGSIAAELAGEETVSPLKARLTHLAKTIAKIGYISAITVAAVHLLDAFWFDAGQNPAIALQRLHDWRFILAQFTEALTLAISILVVAVPEGLPMMITVVLSSNMKRMLRSGVLVRRLVGMETAGSMDLLFTDKTGTLTSGQLTVEQISNGFHTFRQAKSCPAFLREQLTDAHMACSSVSNATETALSRFWGCRTACPASSPSEQIPFDSSRKYAAARVHDVLYIRGAPEFLLPLCTAYRDENGKSHPMTPEMQRHLAEETAVYARAACRILIQAEGLAADFPLLLKNGLSASLHLTFLAFYVLRDELRPAVRKAVDTCAHAGIQIVMLTGDHADTAAAVGQQCGILPQEYRLLQSPEDPVPPQISLVLDGPVLRTMDDAALLRILPQLRVISRVTPADKSHLVRLAKQAGHITGMTGDGVNDAPALKAADVGFAMGSGTDIAREAGDIVITDDNFVSITQAVLYGRTIFSSIRKFITFQLTMNFTAVLVSVLGTMFGIDHPVTVIQMLWVNIIMDTLGSLAFAGEPALPEYMFQPPVRRQEPILTRAMSVQIAVTAAFSTLVSLFFLFSPSVRHRFGGGELLHLTRFFAFFIFMGIAIALCTRTSRIRLFSNIRRNRPFLLIMPLVAGIQLLILAFGGDIFRCQPLSFRELLFCAFCACSVLPADAIRKSLLAVCRQHTR